MTRRLLTVSALVLLAAGLTGCLDWVQQTATYQHDPKTDTVRIFQTYHGLFGSDEPGEITRNEIEQLDSVFKSQRTFFFANWITEYSRTKVEEALTNSLAATPDATGAELARQTAQKQNLEALLKLLLANVRVENGAFYLDADKRLCGVQRVTLTRFSQLLPAANRVLRDLIIEEAAKPDGADERKARLNRWLERKQDVLTVAGNRLLIRGPASRAEYDKAVADEPKYQKLLAEFRAGGGEIRHENDEAIVRIGTESDPRVSVRLSVAEKPYRTNLVNYLTGKQPIRPTFAPEAAAIEFLNAAPPGPGR
ncbi:hypothetical protein LBMAG56_47100 [Verrucomicrobiota bacterium]|nr:hypothetical protein LBMAG56_47100 [Verrucomicrobiota bacterium]